MLRVLLLLGILMLGMMYKLDEDLTRMMVSNYHKFANLASYNKLVSLKSQDDLERTEFSEDTKSIVCCQFLVLFPLSTCLIHCVRRYG
jgi:hypothetical protein